MNEKPGPKPKRYLFGFLDETGLLRGTSPVFGLGLLVINHPNQPHKNLLSYKDRKQYYQEFKFSDIRDRNLDLYKGLVDLFFDQRNVEFHVVLYDKQQLDIENHFKGDFDKAYNSFASRLICKALGTSDYIVVIADDVNTKKSDDFEKQAKEKVKMITRRNALFGVCRLESRAVSEIQLADVLLGTIAYSYKIRRGMQRAHKKSAKFKMVKHLQRKLNVEALAEEMDLKMRNNIRFTIQEFFRTKK